MKSDEAILAAIAPFGGEEADMPFWKACLDGKFTLHRCDLCNRHYWPASRCIVHGDAAMGWVAASGRGSIHTYTVQHHAYTAEMRSRVPYAVVVVRLEEGPFYHGALLDCPISEVAVGLNVEVSLAKHESGLLLPMFRQSSCASAECAAP